MAACAAVADARFPVDAQPTEPKPNSFAFDIATPAGLSLNENVGFTESFFIYRLFKPISLPSFSALTSGVIPAFMLTIFDLSLIGRSSKYLQYVCSRFVKLSFDKVVKL